MEYKIYNAIYKTCAIAYPMATISEKSKKEVGRRLEAHLIEEDPFNGKNLGLEILEIIDTGLKSNAPGILNSPILAKKLWKEFQQQTLKTS